MSVIYYKEERKEGRRKGTKGAVERCVLFPSPFPPFLLFPLFLPYRCHFNPAVVQRLIAFEARIGADKDPEFTGFVRFHG